jgi:hypothetical protein
MADTFTIVREVSRREIESHVKRFVGVTASVPVHKDVNGLLEWTCDVRIGYDQDWAIIKDVIISQWAIGIVSDLNVPVLCERSENGQLTIIARSNIELPDITLNTYTYNDLDFVFMANLTETGGTYYDGFGYATTDPTTQTGQERVYTHTIYTLDWGSTEFTYGTTEWGSSEQGWTES